MTTINNKNEILDNDFVFVDDNKLDADKIVRPSLTFWKDAWRRFRQNKIALGSLCIIAVIILLAIFAPMFSAFEFSEQSLNLNQPPNETYYFGTDDLGRDIYTRLWSGTRVSLIIAVVVVFINTFVGIIYGGIAGYMGGKVDLIMMRIVEIISSVPSMLWMMLMVIVMEPGLFSIVIALCVTGWVGVARLFRGQVLQLREMEFVQVSKTLGANPMWIIGKHLFPNALSPLITNIAFAVPGAIFAEASLSYFGLGIPYPMASLGSLISDGANKIHLYPYQLIIPAIVICILMLCFNLIGDGLRDAFDPSLRNK